MSSTPAPDERTIYSHRQHAVDPLAWPVFSEHVLHMLRSAGEVLRPEPGELLWDAGDPYDLTLVLAGGVLLVDRRDDRVVFVIEEGAVGDVRAGSVKRVASAVGEGSVVIAAVHSYLAAMQSA